MTLYLTAPVELGTSVQVTGGQIDWEQHSEDAIVYQSSFDFKLIHDVGPFEFGIEILTDVPGKVCPVTAIRLALDLLGGSVVESLQKHFTPIEDFDGMFRLTEVEPFDGSVQELTVLVPADTPQDAMDLVVDKIKSGDQMVFSAKTEHGKTYVSTTSENSPEAQLMQAIFGGL